ncbi:CBS domain-containing protein [Rubinisphaera sp. JC750]|uniref:CBS domain-containing protein n=1 Tax=Rubinisphaera sp. JC750 TaxID=2898658 RepID=UPI001F2DA699|nr:CBS domain-containing protein [Rubinisphaera sp. JC750]
MASESLSARFVRAYNQVDQVLRRKSKSDGTVGFAKMVRILSAKGDSIIKQHKNFLEEVAHLRNFFIHGEGVLEVEATPSEHTVVRLEQIASNFLSPPKVVPLFQCDVQSCASSDLLSVAVSIMKQNDFSQLPVYDGDSFVGLLTTHTIALYLADSFLADDFAMNVPIAEVLKYHDKQENCFFLTRDCSLFETIDKIESAMKAGTIFVAAIITATGEISQAPIGIVTVSDVPVLRSHL